MTELLDEEGHVFEGIEAGVMGIIDHPFPSQAGRAARGVLVCRVPERHERGHRHIVRDHISWTFFLIVVL